MTKIYHVDASGRKYGSITRKLTKKLIEKISPDHGEITYRDISQGMPFVNDTIISGYATSENDQTKGQREALALSNELIKELNDNEIYVFGVPIYNFSMPAAFKAWCDQVARVGITFKYTNFGPIGLLNGKKAYVVVSSGGTKIDSDIDFLTPWIRHYMNFIGISDLEIIGADGLNLDREASILKAKQQIEKLKAFKNE